MKGSRRPFAGFLLAMAVGPSCLAGVPGDDLDRLKAEERASRVEAPASPAPGGGVSRALLVGSLKVYRYVLSSQDGSRCPFQPSCSHFAEEAVRERGALRGILMASDRVQRCHLRAWVYYRQDLRTGLLVDSVGGYDAAHDAWTPVGGELPPRKSPVRAALLSSIVPGSGKVYAGRTQDGISSFLATGVPATFAVSNFRRDGVSSVRGWFHGTLATGFYLGNIWGSAEAARQASRPLSAWHASPSGAETPEPESADARYDRALAALASGRYAESTSRFLDIATRDPGDLGTRARFFQSISHLNQRQWSSARASMRLAAARDAGYAEALRLLDTVDTTAAASPRTARVLSALLPGAGQVYAGRIGKGLTALAVNSLLVYYIKRTLDTDSYAETGLSAVPLFWRYYSGNIQAAGRYADRANHEKGRRETERYLDTLAE